MSFENEKLGLQKAADIINLAMNRGAYGFNDLESLIEAKQGIIQQHKLLSGGLAAIIGGQELSDIPTIPTPKLAIAQPLPDEKEESKEVMEDSKISNK